MSQPDPRFAAFIREHHVLTLATLGAEGPYCCSLFYAFDETRLAFVVATDEATEHASHLLRCDAVAANIVLETSTIGKIRGLQLRGRMRRSDAKTDAMHYFSAFPYARVMRPTLWVFEPEWMKLTDNRLGFGTKLIWERSLA